MKRQDEKAVTDRRSFLKLAGAVTAAGGTAVAAATPSTASEGKTREGLYRETEHVRRYYELAKF